MYIDEKKLLEYLAQADPHQLVMDGLYFHGKSHKNGLPTADAALLQDLGEMIMDTGNERLALATYARLQKGESVLESDIVQMERFIAERKKAVLEESQTSRPPKNVIMKRDRIIIEE